VPVKFSRGASISVRKSRSPSQRPKDLEASPTCRGLLEMAAGLGGDLLMHVLGIPDFTTAQKTRSSPYAARTRESKLISAVASVCF